MPWKIHTHLTFTKTNMLQKHNYNTEKILTEKPTCYRNATYYTEYPGTRLGSGGEREKNGVK